EGLRRRDPDRIGQGGREDCHEFDSLGGIPVGGRGSDTESDRELGIRVSHPQVSECEQGLAAGVQTPPAGADRTTVLLQTGWTGSAGTSWTRRRPTGRQACEASGGDGSLGRKPIYQGLHHVVSPTGRLLLQ